MDYIKWIQLSEFEREIELKRLKDLGVKIDYKFIEYAEYVEGARLLLEELK